MPAITCTRCGIEIGPIDWETDLELQDYHRVCFLAAVEDRQVPRYHQTIEAVLMGIETATLILEEAAQDGTPFVVEGYDGTQWVHEGVYGTLEAADDVVRQLHKAVPDTQFRIDVLPAAVMEEDAA